MDLGKRLRLRVVDSTNDQGGGEFSIPPLRSLPHVCPQPKM